MTTQANILINLQANKTTLQGLGVRQIGLFGSYIRNAQTESSDIDILLDFEPIQETFDNFMAAYDFLEVLFKNERVELVTLNGLSSHIGSQIVNEVVYA